MPVKQGEAHNIRGGTLVLCTMGSVGVMFSAGCAQYTRAFPAAWRGLYTEPARFSLSTGAAAEKDGESLQGQAIGSQRQLSQVTRLAVQMLK